MREHLIAFITEAAAKQDGKTSRIMFFLGPRHDLQLSFGAQYSTRDQAQLWLPGVPAETLPIAEAVDRFLEHHKLTETERGE